MTQPASKTPQDIRALRARHPEMRERDFARINAISEAELVAAHVGHNAVRLRPDVDALLNGLTSVGEVMALTRNESAVHEKIGPYEKLMLGTHACAVLGEEIDLRIFPQRWASGYAVEKRDEAGTLRRSLQFFAGKGEAVHKVHARPATNLDAWALLVDNLRHPDQTDQAVLSPAATTAPAEAPASLAELRAAWAAMTDTHQFFPMLKKLRLPRLDALEMVGEDFAWQLETGAVEAIFDNVKGTDLPVMVFVGNAGCVQIHAGPIVNVKNMGPWLNVMDETFHLHFRLDHIASAWAVRKPTSDGHVTSVEIYDANRELIIQFFGKRQEGTDERAAWRGLVERLPVPSTSNAA